LKCREAEFMKDLMMKGQEYQGNKGNFIVGIIDFRGFLLK